MKTLITKHIPDWRDRLILAFIFAIFGTMIGFIPQIYYQYFDDKTYVTIEQPISFDKKVYGKCDTLKALVKGQSLIDSTAHTTYDLVKINEDKTFSNIKRFERDTYILNSREFLIVSTDYPLNCNIQPGVYFFKGILQYYVRGTARYYPFNTAPFTVLDKDYATSEE